MADERGAAAAAAGRWGHFIGIIGDAGEIAKLIALLLAIAGLVTVYFPGLRREWEQISSPSAWYWIGTVGGSGRFRSNGYVHPLWNNPKRPVGLPEVLALGRTIVITGPGPVDSLHVGRAEAGAGAELRFVFGDNACLAVSKIKPLASRRTRETFLWAKAQKVTC